MSPMPRLLLAALLLASPVAHAGAATDVLKAKQTALLDQIRKGASPSPGDLLDLASLAEASLGTEWAARSAAEKAQYSDLLRQLVTRSYERNLKKIVNFNVEYLGESPSQGASLVKTKAVSRTNAREEPVEISFLMTQVGGKWLVRDIVTEGVSLVSSYRSQFTKIIKKDGFPALLAKMKDKLAKGDF